MMGRRRSNGANSASPHPTFVLGNDYRLTSLKVIRLDELQSNHYADPLWELSSKSGSSPIRIFNYGSAIPGMQPAYPGEQAQPLTTNVAYRLLLEVGRIKGQHDFTLSERDYPDAE